MLYENNYRGKIPIELYLELLSVVPQRDDESDMVYVQRLKNDGDLARKLFGTSAFKIELAQAVARRTMAQAGAQRVGSAKSGPTLIKLSKPGDKQAVSTISERYRNELMIDNERTYKYAAEAYQMLIDQFDAPTPANGSVFWSGINEIALAKKVEEWNNELGSELFGQLEATTVARYVNKKFVWKEGGVFQKYFQDVSGKLGHAASGHVTAVMRCGLRNTSIFTETEFPRIQDLMQQQLKANKNKHPSVTDVTIVVIEPKNLPSKPIQSFTNKEIAKIPIIKAISKSGYICSRDDCEVVRGADVKPEILDYWARKGPVQESRAAKRIKKDFAVLTKWP